MSAYMTRRFGRLSETYKRLMSVVSPNATVVPSSMVRVRRPRQSLEGFGIPFGALF